MARTETHFIWTGDYADRLQMLQAAAEKAREDTSPLLAGETHPYEQLSAEYDELLAEAEREGHKVVLRGLRDDEWDEIVEQHPPRTEGPAAEGDKMLGFNEKTGLRTLIFAALVEPQFDTRSRFDDWVREVGLTRGELSALGLKAWRLTNGTGPVDPKLLPPLPPRAADES